MTAANMAKAAGLRSLTQLSEMCGYRANGRHVVSTQTLNNWHNDKPKLFEIVVAGGAARLQEGGTDDGRFEGMSASLAAKSSGLKSLSTVSVMCGTKKNGNPVVSLPTLFNWSRCKPRLFALVIDGAKTLK